MKNELELRSEKARKIIGYIPPVLVRSGITIITGILFILFWATYFISYPENIVGTVTVHEMEPSTS